MPCVNRAVTARDRRSIVSNEGALQFSSGRGTGDVVVATNLSPTGWGVPTRVGVSFMTGPISRRRKQLSD